MQWTRREKKKRKEDRKKIGLEYLRPPNGFAAVVHFFPQKKFFLHSIYLE